MKVERLSQDKIKIFLTFDDLVERGIQKEDLWRDIPKIHELFNEMMEQAYSELGFEVTGPVAVEVFALPAQGMVVIVTRGQVRQEEDFDDLDVDDELEVEITLEQSDVIAFAFRDFEYLIQAALRINRDLMDGGTLYHYKSQYILVLTRGELTDQRYDVLIAILSEFGEAVSISEAVLAEYGKVVIPEDAVKVLCFHFSKPSSS